MLSKRFATRFCAETLVARFVVLILVGVSVSDCAHYQAARLDLDAAATAIESRQLPVPPSGILTYGEALKFALDNAATVKEAAAQYASALAAARTARVGPAMALTLTAEYSKDSDPQRPWLYGGALDIPLDFGGARSGRIGTADLAAMKARYDLIEAIWTARMALRRAVLDGETSRLQLEIISRQVELRRERLAILERRVERGEDGRAVALLAANELSASTQRLSAATAECAKANAALAAALGVTIEALTGVEILAAADWAPAPGEIDALRHNALVGRADVLGALVEYDIAEQGLRTAVAGQYPKITLGPGFTWERGLTKLPFNLGLALPPADLNRAAIREAELRRAQAGASLEAVQALIFAQTDAATTALASADRARARVAAEDLTLARREIELMSRAVAFGENDRTDLLGAEAAAVDAELAAFDALRARSAALTDLEAATRHSADPVEPSLLSDALASLEQTP